MLIGIFDSLGAQTDRLRCEACQNLILSPMNTGLLRCAVATVLTVYGIETGQNAYPLIFRQPVATVLTVYGIETRISLCREYIWIICVATVLTVYGIETQNHS